MALRERRCKMAPPAPAVLRARFSRGQDTPGSRLRSLIENHAYDFDLRARAEKIVDEWKAAGVSHPPANDAAAASSDLFSLTCTCSIRKPLWCVLDLLLGDLGADPNAATKAGLTPLHLAAKYDNERGVDALLRHGAKPLAEDGAYRRTALHFAAAYAGERTVLRLLDARGGEEAACRSSAQGTPLQIASLRPLKAETRGVLRRLREALGETVETEIYSDAADEAEVDPWADARREWEEGKRLEKLSSRLRGPCVTQEHGTGAPAAAEAEDDEDDDDVHRVPASESDDDGAAADDEEPRGEADGEAHRVEAAADDEERGEAADGRRTAAADSEAAGAAEAPPLGRGAARGGRRRGARATRGGPEEAPARAQRPPRRGAAPAEIYELPPRRRKKKARRRAAPAAPRRPAPGDEPARPAAEEDEAAPPAPVDDDEPMAFDDDEPVPVTQDDDDARRAYASDDEPSCPRRRARAPRPRGRRRCGAAPRAPEDDDDAPPAYAPEQDEEPPAYAPEDDDEAPPAYAPEDDEEPRRVTIVAPRAYEDGATPAARARFLCRFPVPHLPRPAYV
ncbi:hypothetical protein JL721_736 [Aureococcus anophagefferens]|nr:hypothetical protein JL721_736 [Aureococcus anophagefferens]